MNKISVPIATILFLTLTISPFSIAGVYKYVDADGNTVYTDTKPKEEQANIEKLNVKDAYTNSMAAPAASSGSGGKDVFKDIQEQQAQETTYAESKRQAKKEAEKSVDDAQKQLDDAKTVKTGDMFPNPGGGIRYTQQYLQRIEAAQRKLDDAQKQYNNF